MPEVIRIKIAREYADKYLETLPGGVELWVSVAQTFLDAYDGVDRT